MLLICLSILFIVFLKNRLKSIWMNLVV